jgi:hypothetical protein
MTDRLAQIWTGFSTRTSLDVSGTTVNGVPRPSSSRYETEEVALPKIQKDMASRRGAQASAALPAGAKDPVQAALSALHDEHQSMRASQRGRGATPPIDHTTPPPSQVEASILADIAFTESKTMRQAGDYLSYAAERQGEWSRRKRRKFLGLF